MRWESWSQFWAMGGYGVYVWGSMGMTAPGSGVKKMELANEGAARAIELLGDSDQVTVFAVDSAAHKIVPLSPVGVNRSNLTNVVRRIEVAGGGIFVYTGMMAAWKELQTAEVGQRHMILFADAADAEEPGEYIRLVDDMVKNQCSIGVIGMGTEHDSDAQFLKDIAARGISRVIFRQYLPQRRKRADIAPTGTHGHHNRTRGLFHHRIVNRVIRALLEGLRIDANKIHVGLGSRHGLAAGCQNVRTIGG